MEQTVEALRGTNKNAPGEHNPPLPPPVVAAPALALVPPLGPVNQLIPQANVVVPRIDPNTTLMQQMMQNMQMMHDNMH